MDFTIKRFINRNPEVDYIKVAKDGEVYYLCSDLANKVLGEGTMKFLKL